VKLPALTASALLTAVQKRSAEVEAAGETLSEQDAELADLRKGVSATTQELAALDQDLSDAQAMTDRWARTAYMSADRFSLLPALTASLPPSDALAQLKTDVAAKRETYLADTAREAPFAAAVAAHHATFQKSVDELTTMLTAHATQLDAEQKSLDEQRLKAGEQILGTLSDRNVRGEAPGPAAVKALQFAYAQLGKPYEFGAEGLDTYDCSGLVQTAYAYAGVKVPRTARPQYRATTPVPVTELVPGDLLFFATDPGDWNTIHHVGFYIGHGRMLHAPHTGTVVKIAPVWWEEFFGATRVVPAVHGKGVGLPVFPGQSPKPSPSRTAAPAEPAGTPTPKTSPKSSPKPSPSVSVAPSASPAASVAPTLGGGPSPLGELPSTPPLAPPALRPRIPQG
jgi:cell wall-associated NlpC family hydrolase